MIDTGDFVRVDFRPVRGREQGGVRPALVLSSATFHDVSEMAIICPITSNAGAWPFKVFFENQDGVSGAVLVDQIRSVHRPTRGFDVIGRASPELIAEVRDVLAELVGIASTRA
ncbi:type II toxin-antitoxin system PemK/MazF family toxin [bacterium]|nr:type II toxin-antitoxin system PemK/MazF family toxin [bacterium]